MVLATLDVQLKDVLLVRQARDKNRKVAKGQAALLLLKDMKVCFLSVAFSVYTAALIRGQTI